MAMLQEREESVEGMAETYHWHATDKRVDDSVPTSCEHQLDCSHVIVGTATIHGTKCNGGRYGGNVDEELTRQEQVSEKW
jgi:hypothetical protein